MENIKLSITKNGMDLSAPLGPKNKITTINKNINMGKNILINTPLFKFN